jgi:hypothetical protein
MVWCFVVQQVWSGPAFDELCMLSPSGPVFFCLSLFVFTFSSQTMWDRSVLNLVLEDGILISGHWTV